MLFHVLSILTAKMHSNRPEPHFIHSCPSCLIPLLQHNQSNTPHMFRTRLIPRINATRYWRRAVVVQVVMQRAVSSAEALFVEEERVVERCEGVEDVEASLFQN